MDFDSLRAVAREHGVSIEKKTSAKSEAEGRDPSVTYALVDDNDEARGFGRSKSACTLVNSALVTSGALSTTP